MPLDLSTELNLIAESEAWPMRDQSSILLRSIWVDFGRSHYLLLGDSLELPEVQHRFTYSNDEVSDTERDAYLNEIGITLPGDLCDSPNPSRSAIITRVKYELLKQYLQSKFQTESIDKLALSIMRNTTQDPLRVIKVSIISTLLQDYNLTCAFPFFAININDENINGEIVPILEVQFSNYVPKSGCWQVTARLPVDNPKHIKAVFRKNMYNENDRGTCVISIEDDYDTEVAESVDIRDIFGIYDFEKKKVIKYRDTMPTW
eukprot:TRINITY_DN6649_c0_g1_i2.p1 TRINITY_DN6649_c0_g1~~TRINITY_DN6649_c0_g1_i2.p1  ORF type:complete len:279 (-),score=46.69 TRINITY_DN6649_c0_g1_i2:166-948(-)